MPRKTVARRTKTRSPLTADQQAHVRDSMMRSAAKIASQLDDFIVNGVVTVAGREVPMTSERLASYRLVLDRTIPTLSATEITKKTSLEAMSQEQLLGRLASIVKERPELAARLLELSGGRLINGTCTAEAEIPDKSEAPAQTKSET